MKHIVIIGNGISGITAARHLRKLGDFRITVISSESKYFFSRTALMYVYMGHMNFEHTQPYEDWFWKKNNIDLLEGQVIELKYEEKQIILSDDFIFDYDELIIATGSKPAFYNWPGSDFKGVQGFYSKQDLELLETNAPNNKLCKRAVIVGGGLIGIELAEMLHSRNINVTMLVREDVYWGNILTKKEGELLGKHIASKGIDLRFNTNLKEINPDTDGRVASVTTTMGDTIPCDFVGLSTGVVPNIDFLKSSGLEIDSGILVNEYLETNIQNIYAIGDCAQQRVHLPNRKSVEAVWYTGRIMGETVANTIAKTRTPYRPGVWFNSAKFFDIEYQTYGKVSATCSGSEDQLYWEDTSEKKSITLAFDKDSLALLGITALGIRLSHSLSDQWISQKKDITYAIDNLPKLNFDPEFYPKVIKGAASKFKEQFQFL
ncbi:NAD(P)/FAD-dependent oxidoreductase [Galbibacter sp.]|jgi:NAD(P)H-nitrite reductase large subunit|uniref:NAD(P)/FAD-dependent oxidoreductase n=1 Tax=Galbibacter sp. TaxID=2918471 RepID=UPI003A8E30EF